MHSRGEDSPLPRRALLVGGIIAALVLLATVALWLWWPGPTADTAAAPSTDTTRTAESPVPLFASDEEALAAARATYQSFLDATDSIGRDGGASSERLYAFATREVADVDRAGFDRFAAAGHHMEGQSSIKTFELQYYARSALPGEVSVAAYTCVSVAGVDVLDSGGTSVVPETRPDLTPFEVGFVFSEDSGTNLQIALKTLWTGQGVC
jgi:hypothetical protein